MKKIYLMLFAAAALLATSCHQPQFIETTADRQGLTSLTAIFTFGPYEDQEMAKLVIEDDTQDRFVIPIPFYYPETSDNQTIGYMTKIRVQAELQPNFTLSPGLGILDLTEDNEFTYTDPHGNSRQIIITGERVKSSACDITSFVLDSPSVTGIVDKAAKHVLLPTRDDVSESTAKVQLSAHATIFPDPTKPRDYTDGMKFTVTADNGTTAEYLVETGDPDKLDSGIDLNSVEKLFNIDPVSRLGLPAYNTAGYYPSLAVSGGKLIFCYGTSDAPMIINGIDGTKVGTFNVGSATADVITNDEAEHIVIASRAEGGASAGTVNVWYALSVKDAPVLLTSFTNPSSFPIGHKMKVMGDITGDAVVTFTAEGIDGVSESTEAVWLKVEGGAAGDPVLVDFSGIGYGGWGSAPVGTATVVPVSTDPASDGWLVDWYGSNADADGNYLLHYWNGSSDTVVALLGNWANNVNCLDSKCFNGCRYAAVFAVSHFPCWGIGPQLYFYEINDPSSPSLMFSNDAIGWYQQGDYSVAAGDVVLAPSADGFYIYVYYFDQNSQALGGYVADCIKR